MAHRSPTGVSGAVWQLRKNRCRRCPICFLSRRQFDQGFQADPATRRPRNLHRSCHLVHDDRLSESAHCRRSRHCALLRCGTPEPVIRQSRSGAGVKVRNAPILAIPVDPAAPPDTTFEPNCRLRSLRDFQLHPLNWERSPKAAIRGEHGGFRRRRVSMEMRTLAAPQPMRRFDPSTKSLRDSLERCREAR